MMKKLLFLMSLFLICSRADCIAQNNKFVYKAAPNKYKFTPSYTEPSNVDIYDLRQALPSNYVTDGSVDYTDVLQSALNLNRNVMFPAFPILINSSGLAIPSNSKVYFQKGSKLKMLKNNKQSYAAIKIFNVTNVSLYNPVIEGDRTDHIGNLGQWGMGISIRASQGINVYGPYVTNCWGDGIYIGSIDGKSSSNVNIQNAYLDNNRRNGLSIVSGTDISIARSLISNTNGQNPMSGIDIEPNNNSDVIKNIQINNVVTFNNSSHGIIISPGSIKGKLNKDISVTVNNHIDDGSTVGLGLLLERVKNPISGTDISGNIKIVNPLWINNSKAGFDNYRNLTNRVKITLSGVKVVDDKNPNRIINTMDHIKKLASKDSRMSLVN